MELIDAIENRHSFRSFKPDAIPAADVRKLVSAAAMAPSSFNVQPWRFYVADGETRAKLAEIMALTTVYLDEYLEVMGSEKIEQAQVFYSELGGAPVVVAVATNKAKDELDGINVLVSAGAAIQNFMLAATELGLGTCNITFSFWVRDKLADLLQVEEGMEISSLILLGYPAGDAHSPDHRKDIAVFRE